MWYKSDGCGIYNNCLMLFQRYILYFWTYNLAKLLTDNNSIYVDFVMKF